MDDRTTESPFQPKKKTSAKKDSARKTTHQTTVKSFDAESENARASPESFALGKTATASALINLDTKKTEQKGRKLKKD